MIICEIGCRWNIEKYMIFYRSYYIFVLFFFKQKTAYEMRISDWSSDVCSSDLREIVNQRAREDRQVARRRVVIRIGQARCIGEVRVVHAQARGVLVHQIGERRFAAGDVFGDRHRRVVAGLDDDAAQQIDQFHLRADADERSEERRVGKEGVSTVRFRWATDY